MNERKILKECSKILGVQEENVLKVIKRIKKELS